MGQPQGLFIELVRWRDKAAKRGKACTFTSDIIPDWLNAEIVAAMETVGHEHAFSFLKQMDDARMAAERRLKRKIKKVLAEFEARAARAVRQGKDPDYDKLFEELRAAVGPEIAALAVDEAIRTSADVGIVFDPTIINQQAVEWARGYSYELVTGLTDTTRKLVSGVARTFVETPGMTQADIVKLLAPAFGSVRADMIAVTEVTRAYSEATNETQRLVNQTGLQMDRIWHTANDDIVCPICGPLNGRPESQWQGEFPNGPPAHPRCRCSTGLSALGDEVHLAEAAELAREREAMLIDLGLPFDAHKPVKIPARQFVQAELDLMTEIEEVRSAYNEARRAGRKGEADGIQSYLDGLEQGLKDEQRINGALWDKYQMTPGQATDDTWRKLADELENDGYSLYKKYSKEGISFSVDEKRGAKDSGYMMVGGKQVMVKQGAFSVRNATRMKGDIWAQGKDEMREAMGSLLKQAGFQEKDIAKASFEQRQKLLGELGQKQMSTTSTGRPRKIDAVPPERRASVVEGIDYDLAATAESSALDPLNLPTLDAYGKMETADLIRSVVLGE